MRGARWTYLVQHYADRAAEAMSDGRAILCPREGSLTYGEVTGRSNRLARALIGAGVRRGDRVALCLERGASSVVAMLAALKADAAYVPLDERWPLERCRLVLDDCSPSAVIVDGGTIDRVRQALDGVDPRAHLLTPGELPESQAGSCITRQEIDALPDDALDYADNDTDLAQIIYTSGSTGRPKGVMISHRNITNYIEWAVPYLRLNTRDRVLGTAPFHFDMSTFDLFAPHRAGATLVIAAHEHTLFPGRLVRLIEEQAVTVWKGVASLLGYLARTGAVQAGRMPSLEQVLFSGERLPTRALMTWMAAFPRTRFYNVYGPTEATGVSTAYALPGPPASAEEMVPIGRACANSEALVLTEAGGLAAPGEAGEICLRGSSLSPGYWNDPQRTARVFVPNPLASAPGDRIYRTGDLGFAGADGELRLIGRLDEQVKWMGYRIELGEITMALQAVPGVEDGTVLLLEGRPAGTEELVGFVALERGSEAGPVLAALRERLPAYMVPRRLVPVPALPRTDRGKLDREALRRLGTVSHAA